MKKNYTCLKRAMLFSGLVLSGIPMAFSQDTTSVRLIAGTPSGDILFLDEDTLDFTTVPTGFGAVHSLFTDPTDNEFYSLIGDGGADRSFYSINPLNGATQLVLDGTGSYYSSAEVTDGGRIFAIEGNGGTAAGTMYEIDLAAQTATSVAVSNVPSGEPRAVGFNPATNEIWVFSGFLDQVFTMTLDTWAQTTLNIDMGSSEVHGANYKNGTFHICTYGGDIMRTPAQGGSVASLVSTTNESLLDVVEISLLNAPTSSICEGDSVLLHARFPSNSYGWLKDGVVISGEITDSLWVSDAGTYQLVSEIDSSGMYYIRSEGYTVNALPNVTLSAPAPGYCTGDSVLLTASAGGTSQWYLNGSPVPGAQGNSLYVSTEGNYNMIKTNMNGCSDSAAVGMLVTELPLPIVSLSAAASYICPGDSVLLSGSPAGGNQWYMNGTIIPGETQSSYYAMAAGNYNMTATTADGCADSAAVNITLVVGSATDCGLGLSENAEGSLSLYPNPAQAYIRFKTDEALSGVQVLSAEGVLIRNAAEAELNQGRVELSGLAPGVYFLSFETASGTSVHKIIKE